MFITQARGSAQSSEQARELGANDKPAAEVEASQATLRRIIAKTERLVGEADEMLRRHRKENDEADASRDD